MENTIQLVISYPQRRRGQGHNPLLKGWNYAVQMWYTVIDYCKPTAVIINRNQQWLNKNCQLKHSESRGPSATAEPLVLFASAPRTSHNNINRNPCSAPVIWPRDVRLTLLAHCVMACYFDAHADHIIDSYTSPVACALSYRNVCNGMPHV